MVKQLAAGEPATLPVPIPGSAELGDMVVLRGIRDDVDLYVAPYRDSSGACFYKHERSDQSIHASWHTNRDPLSCTDAAHFNGNGHITTTSSDARPKNTYTMAVTPDAVTIDPSLGNVHPSGHVITFPGEQLDQLTINSGELRRRP